MEDPTTSVTMRPDARELILSDNNEVVCESYIFEPATAERALGRLYIVGEIENRGGIGRELLDMTVQALQREYYRDPQRGVLSSFESALHQANLVLHDAADQGVRDWMGYFHVATAVLANETLHISTAGHGNITLIRRSRATLLSQDLSYSPVTNPLRTFSQVASGTVSARDVLFLGTGEFPNLFRVEDLARFAIEHSADTISTRLEQLYEDQQSQAPLGVLVVALLPEHIAVPRRGMPTTEIPETRARRTAPTTLRPRQPIVIHRTALRAFLAIMARFVLAVGAWLRHRLWPTVIAGSRQSGRLVLSASRQATSGAQQLAQGRLSQLRKPTADPLAAHPAHPPAQRVRWQLPRLSVVSLVKSPATLFKAGVAWGRSLPRTSKIFALLTVLLAVVLVISLLLLQHKRAADSEIQQASEMLHEARTKLAAAETALIYNNREQAQTLLGDVQSAANQLAQTGVYVDELQELQAAAATINDRLQKIVRASTVQTQVVGDFATHLDGAKPTSIVFVSDKLYTFQPETNTILAMPVTGGTVETVRETSQGVGYLQEAIVHEADKNVLYSTSTPGIAVLDTKTNALTDQPITFTSDQPSIGAFGVYGNRLYVYDSAADNIFSYSKTLRGYVNGTPWITADDVPKDSIVGLTIDGSIYTLHSDGRIFELFKGEAADFTLEPVDPPLAGATQIFTTDELPQLYIFDPSHQRIVIYSKEGELIRQFFLDVAHELADFVVTPDGKTAYVLDGTRVLAVPLVSE